MASVCQRCGAPIGPGALSCSMCGLPLTQVYHTNAFTLPQVQDLSSPGRLPRPHATNLPGTFPREHIPRDETLVFETRPNYVPYVIQPLIILPLLIAFFLLSLFVYGGRTSTTCLLLGALFLVVLPVLQVIYGIVDWMSRKFALTSDKIVASSGIFSRNLYQCTYDKVQNITLHQGLFGRMVGYGTIAFWTAGLGGGAMGMGGYQGQVIGGGGVIWFRVNDPVNLKRYVEEVVSYYQKEKKLQDYKTMAAMMSESQKLASAGAAAQSTQTGPAKFCSKCGSRCNMSALFCEKCGSKFGT